MKIQDLMKKNGIAVLCAISLVALALPAVNIITSMEILGSTSANTESLTGWALATDGILGLPLIVGPILLLVMNYIPQLQKYKGLLAVAVPALCLVILIIRILEAKSYSMSSTSEDYGINLKIAVGVGGIILFVSYLGTILAGAVTYHNFTLDKAGLEKLKSDSSAFLNNLQDRMPRSVEESAEADEKSSDTEIQTESDKPKEKHIAKSSSQRYTSANKARRDEVIALLEKLASMKESGILTEEEFSQKKKELLEEI